MNSVAPETALPVLYSFRRCPYAMRTRMTLLATGHACELREVVLRDKPAEMLAASPKGTVPVLVDARGTVRDESLHIMLWALRKNDPDRWLTPTDGDLTKMLALIERFDNDFKHHLDRYKYASRYTAAGEAVEPLEHREAAGRMLDELNDWLARSRWLFGDSIALADIALAPFIRQFANTDPAWFAQQPWLFLQRWLAAIIESDLFLQCMRKYPIWRSGNIAIEMR